MKLKLGLFSIVILLSNSVLCSSRVLIGGHEAKDGEFEEVVRIRSGSAGCSASVIGPRVILTAAHCIQGDIQDLKTKDFIISRGRRDFVAKCEIAPDYTESVGDQDMALCLTESELSAPYASVSLSGPKIGDMVTLIGYGCINPGGGGGNDGILRYGSSPVTRESESEYYSFHTRSQTALCFGDSGGPAFKLAEDPTGHHLVMGVNSRGNIQDLSLLTAVYHPNSVKFMRDFESSHGVEICGLSKDCLVSKDPRDDDNLCKRERRKLKRREIRLEKAKADLSECLSEK